MKEDIKVVRLRQMIKIIKDLKNVMLKMHD